MNGSWTDWWYLLVAVNSKFSKMWRCIRRSSYRLEWVPSKWSCQCSSAGLWYALYYMQVGELTEWDVLVCWQVESVAFSNLSWVWNAANYMTRCKNMVIIKVQLTSSYCSDCTMGRTIQGSILGRDKKFYSLLKCPTSSGAHPAPFSVRTGGPSPAVKWWEHEDDSVKVRNDGTNTASPLYLPFLQYFKVCS
jgi:hypothetical protein